MPKLLVYIVGSIKGERKFYLDIENPLDGETIVDVDEITEISFEIEPEINKDKYNTVINDFAEVLSSSVICIRVDYTRVEEILSILMEGNVTNIYKLIVDGKHDEVPNNNKHFDSDKGMSIEYLVFENTHKFLNMVNLQKYLTTVKSVSYYGLPFEDIILTNDLVEVKYYVPELSKVTGFLNLVLLTCEEMELRIPTIKLIFNKNNKNTLQPYFSEFTFKQAATLFYKYVSLLVVVAENSRVTTRNVEALAHCVLGSECDLVVTNDYTEHDYNEHVQSTSRLDRCRKMLEYVKDCHQKSQKDSLLINAFKHLYVHNIGLWQN